MNVYPMERVLVEARRLQEQVTALRAENAQLKEQVERYETQWRIAEQDFSSLMADVSAFAGENTKLRELAAALCRCADAGKPCATCPLSDGEGGCLKADRMCELEIEVGE